MEPPAVTNVSDPTIIVATCVGAQPLSGTVERDRQYGDQSAVGSVFKPKGPLVALGHGAGDGQAKSASACIAIARFLAPVERAHNSLKLVHRKAGPAVAYLDDHLAVALLASPMRAAVDYGISIVCDGGRIRLG